MDPHVQKATAYLNTLCSIAPHRRTGSSGNRAATDFIRQILEPLGYDLDVTPFACLDHAVGGATLVCGDEHFEVHTSPYSLGCGVEAELMVVSSVEELEACFCRDKLLLMRGPICAEQLMPKNFAFYNPDHHKRIYALLEAKQPAAIITATNKNPQLVGSSYPFPLIEDGDFDIPSVYCTDAIGDDLASRTGQRFRLTSEAERIPAIGRNVIARKNPDAQEKIVVCAHIDTKENTPGALDNAAGCVVLLLLAELLVHHRARIGIELIALNGEEHYSAAGQMNYLRRYGSEIGKVMLVVNVDGAGYVKGNTAYSFYDCPDHLRRTVQAVFDRYPGLRKGPPWYQGDHMVFVQHARPAIAVTSELFEELMADVLHSSRDVPDLVDCGKLVEVARALGTLILQDRTGEALE